METTVDPFEKLAASGWHRVRAAGGFMSSSGPLWAAREGQGWVYGVWSTDAHLNPAGFVHGGLLATLVDHAISTVAWECAGRTPCVTVQLDAQFLAPVSPGVLIEARAHLVRRTASLLFMRGLLQVAGQEVLVAQALMKVHSRSPNPRQASAPPCI
ncbi:PaaI family thioesterase [Variovorax paradoxus]|uniref:Thioesterase superfamily protein n=1 Tax=Variovorax paradoxus TaxID=34073 RepID=A0A0H2M984_VARPD|nr:PaaI family thioesterase [Variovorax paradoxus]KLN53575.1 thioesterase superfamily protein [Variovorax paradoxus]